MGTFFADVFPNPNLVRSMRCSLQIDTGIGIFQIVFFAAIPGYGKSIWKWATLRRKELTSANLNS